MDHAILCSQYEADPRATELQRLRTQLAAAEEYSEERRLALVACTDKLAAADEAGEVATELLRGMERDKASEREKRWAAEQHLAIAVEALEAICALRRATDADDIAEAALGKIRGCAK